MHLKRSASDGASDDDDGDIMTLLDQIDRQIDGGGAAAVSGKRIGLFDGFMPTNDNTTTDLIRNFPKISSQPASQPSREKFDLPAIPHPMTVERWSVEDVTANREWLVGEHLRLNPRCCSFTTIRQVEEEMKESGKIPWMCLMVKEYRLYGQDIQATLCDGTGKLVDTFKDVFLKVKSVLQSTMECSETKESLFTLDSFLSFPM